jgi:predicted nucleotidyltransferase
MTTNNITLQSYAQEVLPSLRALDTKSQVLKEWEADQTFLTQKKAEIKAIQEEMKAYVENKEPDLVREIKDLKTDIGLAVKAMVKGTDYKSAQMKQYLSSRAKDKVDDVLAKAELFEELEEVLN